MKRPYRYDEKYMWRDNEECYDYNEYELDLENYCNELEQKNSNLKQANNYLRNVSTSLLNKNEILIKALELCGAEIEECPETLIEDESIEINCDDYSYDDFGYCKYLCVNCKKANYPKYFKLKAEKELENE